MTVRDIGFHLERTLGVQLSHDTISKITDGILEEVKARQTRPLDPIYPIPLACRRSRPAWVAWRAVSL